MRDNTESTSSARATVTGSRTARWQPSARDISSPTYDGSGGYRSLGQTGTGRRRLSLGWVAMALVAAVGAFALIQVLSITTDRPLPESLQSVAILEIVQGSVGILTGDGTSEPVAAAPVAFAPLGAGAPIQVGAVIASSYRPEMPGRAALRLASGPSVRLDHGTRMQMASANTLVLERGAVYVDSAAGSAVEVRTVFGVVRDIGTQFEVRLLDGDEDGAGDPALRVRVREGEVELEPEVGRKQGGTVGEEVILYGDGKVERREVAIQGEEWDWVVDLAPSIDLEGWSLHRFVTWLGREGGWEIRYTTPEIETQAREIILHGSSEGLGPLQAAAMVFEGTGLRFLVDTGVLHIDEPGGV